MNITKYFLNILAKYDAEIINQYVETLDVGDVRNVARDSFYLKKFTVHFNYSFHSDIVPIGNIIEELDNIVFEFSHRNFSNNTLEQDKNIIILSKEELQWFEYAVQLLTNNEHYINHVEAYDNLKKLYRKLDLELSESLVGVQDNYILPMQFDCQTLWHQYQFTGGHISLKLDALKLQIFGGISKDNLSAEWLVPFDKFNFFNHAKSYSHIFRKEHKEYIDSKKAEKAFVENV